MDFSRALPAADPMGSGDCQLQAKSEGAMRQPTVLIVDDEDDIRVTLMSILEREGYNVVQAADGDAALAHLEQHEVPAAMLLDLMMPRLSGWDVLATCAARQRLRNMPVIVMSALDAATAHVHAGSVAYFRKPLDLDRLLDRLDELTAGPPGASAGLAS